MIACHVSVSQSSHKPQAFHHEDWGSPKPSRSVSYLGGGEEAPGDDRVVVHDGVDARGLGIGRMRDTSVRQTGGQGAGMEQVPRGM